MNYVGYFAMAAAAVMALVSVNLLYAGARRKGNAVQNMKVAYQTVYAIFGLVSVSILILLYGFITNDFSFDYVAANSSADMSLFFRIAALWAGQEGSFLLWLWFVSGAAALIAYTRSIVCDKLTSNALMVMSVVQAFMLSFMLVLGNPFKLAAEQVGLGMNPLLMHWAMVLHPPTLFVGYALMTVPFAYALAALLDRDSSAAWVERSQRWNLVGWLFLSLGIFLGAAWAYVVLGWGGYWGWDPVENASLLPWLGATALLHSYTIYRQRRSFKRWAITMSVFSFFMVIMAAFMTRSGVVQSVHSFEGDSSIVFFYAVVIMSVIGFSGYLLANRWQDFESEHIFKSWFSRDAMYHVNNIILLFCAAVILMGAFMPSITGQTIGIGVYDYIARPLGIILLFIISICPLLDFGATNAVKFGRKTLIPGVIALVSAYPWYLYWKSLEKMVKSVNADQVLPTNGWLALVGFVVATFAIVAAFQIYGEKIAARIRADKEAGAVRAVASFFIKTPGQAGGFITHLGIAVTVIGLIGSSMYVATLPVSLADKSGASFSAGGMKFVYKGLTQSAAEGKEFNTTTFAVTGSNGKSLGNLAPAYVYYTVREQPGMNADLLYEPFRDVFFVFQGINEENEMLYELKVNPLISFVWGGSVLLILGVIIAALPRRRELKGK
jgi:cytochrome c-type biogenesis protein CcmF